MYYGFTTVKNEKHGFTTVEPKKHGYCIKQWLCYGSMHQKTCLIFGKHLHISMLTNLWLLGPGCPPTWKNTNVSWHCSVFNLTFKILKYSEVYQFTVVNNREH